MVSIQLEDAVAEALTEHARAQGMSLEAYLTEMAIQQRPFRRISGEEAVRLIEGEAGPGGTHYVGTFSREDIYTDHD
jgi:hypothetical protein